MRFLRRSVSTAETGDIDAPVSYEFRGFKVPTFQGFKASKFPWRVSDASAYHAPSMRNEVRLPARLSSETSTESTRAARGPSRKRECSPESWSRVPCASTSTVPSGLLRTQPAIARMWASRSTNQRKPTPWTRPRILKRRARIGFSLEIIFAVVPGENLILRTCKFRVWDPSTPRATSLRYVLAALRITKLRSQLHV